MAEDRFDRLEGKIDKLTDAVARLVVIEERQSNQAARVVALETLTDKHGTRLTELEHSAIRWQNRALGIVMVLGLVWQLGVQWISGKS